MPSTIKYEDVLIRINPNDAYRLDYSRNEELGGLECIGCGCCTFTCPAKRRLSQSITMTKRYVLAEKKKGASK